MSELSVENAALVERVAGVDAKGGKPFEMRPATLNRLLDAAREEAREEGYAAGHEAGYEAADEASRCVPI